MAVRVCIGLLFQMFKHCAVLFGVLPNLNYIKTKLDTSDVVWTLMLRINYIRKRTLPLTLFSGFVVNCHAAGENLAHILLLAHIYVGVE